MRAIVAMIGLAALTFTPLVGTAIAPEGPIIEGCVLGGPGLCRLSVCVSVNDFFMECTEPDRTCYMFGPVGVLEVLACVYED